MRHRLWILGGFGSLILFFVWLGGFFIFNRTVFAYVKKNCADISGLPLVSNDKSSRQIGKDLLSLDTSYQNTVSGRTNFTAFRSDFPYEDTPQRKVLDGQFAALNSNLPSPIGIAVLTGGINRIEKAIQLLNEGVGERLLISGVRPGTSLGVIASRKDVILKNAQPIDLGYEATDTVGNAKEVREWTEKYHIKEFYVVTSFYHIPRSRLELQHELPDAVMHFVAVDTPNVLPEWWKSWRSFKFMAAEYTKFLIVYIQYAFDRLFI